ncbi:tyrosyl-DNA phosphodiesterase 2-like [Centroberyx affinis]|uniref:tyrosyl-DNA phosphodiesterase 2-like n=1 Tax=Centroberyx affinis TaxID=166261 RepID=UPI003A5BE9F7
MSTPSESDKQSVSNLEETRARLCDEFATVTGSDSAVAQCYLAENEWEMERALNSFFEADMERVFEVEDSPERETSPKPKRKKVEAAAPGDCIDLTQDSPASSSKGNTAENKQKPSEEEDSKLSLITWNVDGLDTDNLGERARGLCSYLVLYTPDVVFLQELIPPYVQYLKKRAVSYTLIEGGEDGYFTGMMLKKSRVKLLKSEIVTYPTTQMMRNLLVAQVNFKGQNVCLMTSHFESCKGHGEERMKQLRLVMQRMREAPDDITVLFGGDTNLRDTEVAKVGLPSSVCDVWERLGKQEHCRYTWDTKANNNKTVPYISRCRFDRVYFRPAAREGVPRLAPDHMALVGLEKLDCGRYTSDHWGIYCSFSAG